MADWETAFYVILNTGPAILGSCANLLIIISFFAVKTSRQPTEIPLVSLSLADFLVCSVYQPLLVLRFINLSISPIYMSSFGYVVMTASMTGLLVVNFDRFSAIYFPYKYMTWMTEKRTIWLVTVSWVISLSSGLLIVSKFSVASRITHSYISLIIVLVPLMYGVIYKEARKQARRIVSDSLPSSQSNLPNRRNTIDKATMMVGLVLVTTLACWMPVTLIPLLQSTFNTEEEFEKAFWWCLTVACANSCVNPFIYVYMLTKFRRSVGKLIHLTHERTLGRLRPICIDERRSNPRLHALELVRTRTAWQVVQEL